MKKLLLFLFAAVCFTSCEKYDYEMMDTLQGHWVQTNNEKSNALVLIFEGDRLTVQNGTNSTKPFGSGDSYWIFYVSGDSELVITDDEYDPEYDPETYRLPLTYDAKEDVLHLEYHRVIGSDIYYTFFRR